MSILLEEDIQTMTSSLIALPIGYITGALLCGALYDILNRELLFLVATILIGIITSVAPSGDYLYMYLAALTSLGFFCGGVDTAGQTYIIYLWRRHKCQWVVMLTLHFLWASGSAVGPFIVRPFLVDIDGRTDVSVKPSQTAASVNCEQNYTANCTDVDVGLQDRVSVVRLGFIAVGCIAAVPGVLFLVVFCLLGPSIHNHKVKGQTLPEPPSTSPTGGSTFKDSSAAAAVVPGRTRVLTLTLTFFLVLLFFVYNFINANMGSFVATFAVGVIGWPNNHGALITSLYFGANCLGKLLYVYPLLRFRPEILNAVQMTTVLVGCALMLLSSWHGHVLWLATATVGLGMSSINAACFFWADGYLTISGRVSSAVMTSGSLGAMLGPMLSGYLFDRHGGEAFVGALLAGGGLQLAVFLFAVLFSANFTTKRHLVACSEVTVACMDPADGRYKGDMCEGLSTDKARTM